MTRLDVSLEYRREFTTSFQLSLQGPFLSRGMKVLQAHFVQTACVQFGAVMSGGSLQLAFLISLTMSQGASTQPAELPSCRSRVLFPGRAHFCWRTLLLLGGFFHATWSQRHLPAAPFPSLGGLK